MMQLVDEMTANELAACAVLCHINQCCLALVAADPSPPISLSQALSELNQSLRALLQRCTETRKTVNDESAFLSREVIVPQGAYLHGAFCTLEACKGVLTFLDTFVANNKNFKQSLSKEDVLSLRKSTDEVYQFIRADALKMKNNLSRYSAIGQVVETLRGSEEGETDHIKKEMSGLIDKQWTERFGTHLIESWQDALDGLLQVKIAVP